MVNATLYYVHDPMCSWRYGFGSALAAVLASLPPEIERRRVLGGLAPDCADPMSTEMRLTIRETWRRIEARIPGTRFNFDFWTRCTPRRSSYPACRAVIAARAQQPGLDEAMTAAIQRAYYREARNPSDPETLIALAEEIGAEPAAFASSLDAQETQAALASEVALARDLGVYSFPSLVLACDWGRWRIPVDYNSPEVMLSSIRAQSTAPP